MYSQIFYHCLPRRYGTAEVLLRMQVFVRGAAGRVDADSAGADAISREMSKANRSTRTLSERSEFVRGSIRCERALLIARDEDRAPSLPRASPPHNKKELLPEATAL